MTNGLFWNRKNAHNQQTWPCDSWLIVGAKLFFAASIAVCSLGCQQSNTGVASSAPTGQAGGENSSKPSSETVAVQQSQEHAKPQQPTSTTNAGKLASAKKWMQDALGDAAETSSQSATASLDWANKTFKSLKDQGLTTAKDTSDWLAQDWNNMESWQYTIISMDANANEATIEKLNQMGAQGWECFHIDRSNYFFKKPSESYLRRLPFKDMIRLLPLLDQSKK